MTPEQEAAFRLLDEITEEFASALDAPPQLDLPDPEGLEAHPLTPIDLPEVAEGPDEFPGLDVPEWPVSSPAAEAIAALPDLPEISPRGPSAEFPSPHGGLVELPARFPAAPLPPELADEFSWPDDGQGLPATTWPEGVAGQGESPPGTPPGWPEGDTPATPRTYTLPDGTVVHHESSGHSMPPLPQSPQQSEPDWPESESGGPDLYALLLRVADGIATLSGQQGPSLSEFRHTPDPSGPLRWAFPNMGVQTPEQVEDYAGASPSVNVTSLNGVRGAGGWGFGSRGQGNSLTDRLEPSRRKLEG